MGRWFVTFNVKGDQGEVVFGFCGDNVNNFESEAIDFIRAANFLIICTFPISTCTSPEIWNCSGIFNSQLGYVTGRGCTPHLFVFVLGGSVDL